MKQKEMAETKLEHLCLWPKSISHVLKKVLSIG